MTQDRFTDDELKRAVAEYAATLLEEGAEDIPDPVFSDAYMFRREKVIALSRKQERRRSRLKALGRIAAVAAVIAVSFGVVLGVSPEAYAAVRNWSLNISNWAADYTVSGRDKAFLIVSPAKLPEGFELSEKYHYGLYTRKKYNNRLTGEYILFEYRRPTDKQISAIRRLEDSASSVKDQYGRNLYITEKNGISRLSWYDESMDLVFHAESGLPGSELADVFYEQNIRLPMYSLEWIPEGYGEPIISDFYDVSTSVYLNSNTASQIIFNYMDLGGEAGISVWKGDGEHSDLLENEKLRVGSFEAVYYPASEHDAQSELVWIDEKNSLVFSLFANMEKEELLRTASSVRCTESEW